MKKNVGIFLVMMGLMCCVSTTVYASTTGELVGLLVKQLGVSEQQATGGAGAVFKSAQGSLEPNDYATLTTAMPEISGYVAKAPEVKKKSSGWMSSASSLMGDSGKKAENASTLLDSFESLGMDGDMLAQFTPIIMDYVKKKGGDICVSLLQSAL